MDRRGLAQKTLKVQLNKFYEIETDTLFALNLLKNNVHVIRNFNPTL
jgi:hypothetical protein